MAAVKSALSGSWLTDVTSAAQAGYGPAQVPGPPDNSPVPVVSTSPNPLTTEAPVSPDGGYEYDTGRAGAWPSVPAGGWLTGPVQRQLGPRERQRHGVLPQAAGGGFWNGDLELATSDQQSQVTDSAGWAQNAPNGRMSSRLTFGQSNPLNNPAWFTSAERPAQAHTAIGAVPLTVYDTVPGTPGYASGDLPDWSMTGGQGNTAYETPGPPPVTYPQDQPNVYDPAEAWA